MAKGDERKGKSCIWRFAQNTTGRISALNYISMLARPWYQSRCRFTVRHYPQHITISVKPKKG